MVFNLCEQNSVASQFLFELRDKNIQYDRARFRRNVERLGQILAYEISKTLEYQKFAVETPVASAQIMKLKSMPVLVTILRAGLPFLQGFLDVFDHADVGFIGAYREEGGAEVKIKMDYVATPSLTGKEVILIDPMLATGKSVVKTLDFILTKQNVSKIHVVSLIAAPEGLAFVEKHARNLSCPVSIWTAAIDSGLNDKFYIVPGLGDAGDLSFGPK
jgi:uracil phosphoribosyltransferase